ncbi:helix-turn-helix transcriptional regulator [Bacillus circulans]|uniref:helix-turn-helix transcriptional regulator n=1 Tax=Niallia circulans TaxID=1397 RepID=UPI001560346A|nr:helix-turn-helix transcriptional regulator [Niallia circulans]NRG26129.1 helix-turn-helix transcriptional regulator [Niallia circulans]
MNAIKAKAIRRYLQESQVKFARRIGVAASTICAIEKKNREISDYVCSKLIRIEQELPSDFYIFLEKYQKQHK